MQHLNINFDTVYRMGRLYGLNQDQKSFAFKMVHNLLPNKERLYRIRKSAAPFCTFCPNLEVDDFNHFFHCEKYANVMRPIKVCLETHLPNISVSMLSKLSYNCEESMELPITWLLITSIMIVWEARKIGKNLQILDVKAELLAQARLLKETKRRIHQLHNGALLLKQMIQDNLN